jgi:histidine triad (HIT) family protein
MVDCLFCKIVSKKIEPDFVYEDEQVIVIKDIHPQAPVHLLLIPKKHIESIAHLEKEDECLVGSLIHQARITAEDYGIAEKGYKLVINTGKEGGQVIPHLHLHLLGGKKFKE